MYALEKTRNVHASNFERLAEHFVDFSLAGSNADLTLASAICIILMGLVFCLGRLVRPVWVRYCCGNLAKAACSPES